MSAASPTAVARASKARRAREAAAALASCADPAPVARRPKRAANAPARVVVTPSSLATWHAWLERLHITVDQVALTATYAVASGRHGDMPVQLVGHGVPALIRAGRKDRI